MHYDKATGTIKVTREEVLFLAMAANSVYVDMEGNEKLEKEMAEEMGVLVNQMWIVAEEVILTLPQDAEAYEEG